jgi:hypothetical protein
MNTGSVIAEIGGEVNDSLANIALATLQLEDFNDLSDGSDTAYIDALRKQYNTKIADGPTQFYMSILPKCGVSLNTKCVHSLSCCYFHRASRASTQ